MLSRTFAIVAIVLYRPNECINLCLSTNRRHQIISHLKFISQYPALPPLQSGSYPLIQNTVKTQLLTFLEN